jgi:hypothetical protein
MSNRRAAASAPEDNDNVEQLREDLRKLQEKLDNLSAAAPRVEEPKVKEPKEFDGKDPSLLPDFLFQLELVFEAKPRTYATERSKIIYAISFLDGSASFYFRPHISEKVPPPWMTDFSSFADHLKSVFGNPDVIGDVTHQLCELKQTGLATEYAAEFRLSYILSKVT